MASTPKTPHYLPRLASMAAAVWLLLEGALAVRIYSLPGHSESVSRWTLFSNFSITGTILYVALAAAVFVLWGLTRVVAIAIELHKATRGFEKLPPPKA